jgi:hypothetical protein
MEKAWMESIADYSLKLQDSLAIFDQSSFSWKMFQLSLFEGLTEFSWNSLQSGMIQDGRLFQPQKLEPAILEKGGSYLPTLTASIEGSNCSPNSTNKRLGLAQLASKGMLPTLCARDWKDNGTEPSAKERNSQSLASTVGGPLNPTFCEELMGYEIGWTELDALATQWFQSQSKRQ